MKDRLSELAFGIFLVVISLGVILFSLSSFIEALKSPILITSWILSDILFFLAGLFVWRVSYVKHERATQPDIVTGDYEVQTQPPHAQLPAPRYVDVPRYFDRGNSQPIDAGTVLRTSADDTTLEVPYRYLLRFLSLPTPARSEWTGKKEQYGACMDFAEVHGLIERTAEGGCKWNARYSVDSRRVWAEQFDVSAVSGGRRQG